MQKIKLGFYPNQFATLFLGPTTLCCWDGKQQKVEVINRITAKKCYTRCEICDSLATAALKFPISILGQAWRQEAVEHQLTSVTLYSAAQSGDTYAFAYSVPGFQFLPNWKTHGYITYKDIYMETWSDTKKSILCHLKKQFIDSLITDPDPLVFTPQGSIALFTPPTLTDRRFLYAYTFSQLDSVLLPIGKIKTLWDSKDSSLPKYVFGKSKNGALWLSKPKAYFPNVNSKGIFNGPALTDSLHPGRLFDVAPFGENHIGVFVPAESKSLQLYFYDPTCSHVVAISDLPTRADLHTDMGQHLVPIDAAFCKNEVAILWNDGQVFLYAVKDKSTIETKKNSFAPIPRKQAASPH